MKAVPRHETLPFFDSTGAVDVACVFDMAVVVYTLNKRMSDGLYVYAPTIKDAYHEPLHLCDGDT